MACKRTVHNLKQILFLFYKKVRHGIIWIVSDDENHPQRYIISFKVFFAGSPHTGCRNDKHKCLKTKHCRIKARIQIFFQVFFQIVYCFLHFCLLFWKHFFLKRPVCLLFLPYVFVIYFKSRKISQTFIYFHVFLLRKYQEVQYHELWFAVVLDFRFNHSDAC